MVILNANYTPTKRKLDLFSGAAAPDSSFPARLKPKGCEKWLC